MFLCVETGEPTCPCVLVSDLFSPAALRSCQMAVLWRHGGDLVSGARGRMVAEEPPVSSAECC